MTEKIQISTKLVDGTIIVIGGDNVSEFMENANEMVGSAGADELQAAFMNLIPTSAGAQQQGFANAQQGFAPQNEQPRAGAGAPPGGQPLCPTHQQPATYKAGGTTAAGKAYNGFYKCPVNDSIISAYGAGGGLKSSCPPPK